MELGVDPTAHVQRPVAVQRVGVRRRELARPHARDLQHQPSLVDDLDEAWVADGTVVALEVVLHGDLPVGLDLVIDPLVEPQRSDVESVLGDDVGKVTECAR